MNKVVFCCGYWGVYKDCIKVQDGNLQEYG